MKFQMAEVTIQENPVLENRKDYNTVEFNLKRHNDGLQEIISNLQGNSALTESQMRTFNDSPALDEPPNKAEMEALLPEINVSKSKFAMRHCNENRKTSEEIVHLYEENCKLSATIEALNRSLDKRLIQNFSLKEENTRYKWEKKRLHSLLKMQAIEKKSFNGNAPSNKIAIVEKITKLERENIELLKRNQQISKVLQVERENYAKFLRFIFLKILVFKRFALSKNQIVNNDSRQLESINTKRNLLIGHDNYFFVKLCKNRSKEDSISSGNGLNSAMEHFLSNYENKSFLSTRNVSVLCKLGARNNENQVEFKANVTDSFQNKFCNRNRKVNPHLKAVSSGDYNPSSNLQRVILLIRLYKEKFHNEFEDKINSKVKIQPSSESRKVNENLKTSFCPAVSKLRLNQFNYLRRKNPVSSSISHIIRIRGNNKIILKKNYICQKTRISEIENSVLGSDLKLEVVIKPLLSLEYKKRMLGKRENQECYLELFSLGKEILWNNVVLRIRLDEIFSIKFHDSFIVNNLGNKFRKIDMKPAFGRIEVQDSEENYLDSRENILKIENKTILEEVKSYNRGEIFDSLKSALSSKAEAKNSKILEYDRKNEELNSEMEAELQIDGDTKLEGKPKIQEDIKTVNNPKIETSIISKICMNRSMSAYPMPFSPSIPNPEKPRLIRNRKPVPKIEKINPKVEETYIKVVEKDLEIKKERFNVAGPVPKIESQNTKISRDIISKTPKECNTILARKRMGRSLSADRTQFSSTFYRIKKASEKEGKVLNVVEINSKSVEHETKIEKRNYTLEEQNIMIEKLKMKVEELNSKIKVQDAKIEESNSKLQEKNIRIKKSVLKIQKQDVKIDEPDMKVQGVDVQIQETNCKIQEHDVKIKGQDYKVLAGDIKIEEIDSKMQGEDVQIQEPDCKNQENELQFQEPDHKIQEQDVKIKEQDCQAQAEDIKIEETDSKIEEKDIRIKKLDLKIQKQDVQIHELDIQIQGEDVKIQELDCKVQELDVQFEEPYLKIQVQDVEIKEEDYKAQAEAIKIEETDFKIQEKDIRIKKLDLKIQKQDVKIHEPDIKIQGEDVPIQEPDCKIQEHDDQFQEPDLKIQEKDVKIKEQDFKVQAEDIKIEETDDQIQGEDIQIKILHPKFEESDSNLEDVFKIQEKNRDIIDSNLNIGKQIPLIENDVVFKIPEDLIHNIKVEKEIEEKLKTILEHKRKSRHSSADQTHYSRFQEAEKINLQDKKDDPRIKNISSKKYEEYINVIKVEKEVGRELKLFLSEKNIFESKASFISSKAFKEGDLIQISEIKNEDKSQKNLVTQKKISQTKTIKSSHKVIRKKKFKSSKRTQTSEIKLEEPKVTRKLQSSSKSLNKKVSKSLHKKTLSKYSANFPTLEFKTRPKSAGKSKPKVETMVKEKKTESKKKVDFCVFKEKFDINEDRNEKKKIFSNRDFLLEGVKDSSNSISMQSIGNDGTSRLSSKKLLSQSKTSDTTSLFLTNPISRPRHSNEGKEENQSENENRSRNKRSSKESGRMANKVSNCHGGSNIESSWKGYADKQNPKNASTNCEMVNMGDKHKISVRSDAIEGSEYTVTSLTRNDPGAPVIIVGGDPMTNQIIQKEKNQPGRTWSDEISKIEAWNVRVRDYLKQVRVKLLEEEKALEKERQRLRQGNYSPGARKEPTSRNTVESRYPKTENNLECTIKMDLQRISRDVERVKNIINNHIAVRYLNRRDFPRVNEELKGEAGSVTNLSCRSSGKVAAILTDIGDYWNTFDLKMHVPKTTAKIITMSQETIP